MIPLTQVGNEVVPQTVRHRYRGLHQAVEVAPHPLGHRPRRLPRAGQHVQRRGGRSLLPHSQEQRVLAAHLRDRPDSHTRASRYLRDRRPRIPLPCEQLRSSGHHPARRLRLRLSSAAHNTGDLFVGGGLSYDEDELVEQLTEILDAGITHVVDMRRETDDAELWAELGIEYLHLGTDDADGHHIPADLFAQARDFADECAAERGTLLVHCRMGINRAPSVAYSILLDRGWGPWAAFDHIRARRPQAAIWYAEDALAAHHDELGSTEPRKNRSLDALVAHIDKVFPPSEQAKVAHHIRQQHAKTEADLACGGTRRE